MIDDSKIGAFETWLVEQTDYRPRTRTKVASDLRTMLAHAGAPPESTRAARMHDFRWVWDLWEEFRETPYGRTSPALPFDRPEVVVSRRRRRKEKPTYEAESVEAKEWARLHTAVAKDARIEAAVIGVLMASGLRISDVLRTPPNAIAAAFEREDGIARVEVKGGKTAEIPVKGGSERAWRRLLEHTDPRERKLRNTFASWVADGSSAEAGSAAYQRVRTALFELGEAAKVTGRVHLHRLRRTVAVRLLEAGVPIEIVQKVLNHESSRTTQGYTSESMARVAGDALRKINR